MLKVLFPWKQNNTKKVIYAMEQVLNEAGPSAEESPLDDLSLLPCHVCNRTFLPSPLKRHVPICEQMARKKRKPFDSLKQRVEGTDMATFFQKSYLKKANPAICIQAQAEDVNGNNKRSKWREKHFELQKTIKNAKGSKSDMSAYTSNSTFVTPNKRVAHLTANQNSTNERCPVCERSFGPKAFDRHVEFCKEQRNRVQVHKSPAVVQQAKERLEARINYRVPPLRQSKRAVVRDKYATSSQNLLSRSNSIASNKSTTSVSSSASTMFPNRRQISNNVNTNERSIKKEVGSKTRLDKIIGDCGDTKESTKSDSNINKGFHTKRTIPTKKINTTDVNDSFQGITVSSLCVEKDKKMVTWKDTVRGQSKVTTSISLTTADRDVKTQTVHATIKKDSERDYSKAPSIGKLQRSRLLMEKLNKFIGTAKSGHVDLDLSNPLNIYELNNEQSETIQFSEEDNYTDVRRSEDILDYSELTQIKEEREVDDESPKNDQFHMSFLEMITRDSAEENDVQISQDMEGYIAKNQEDDCSVISNETSEKKTISEDIENEDQREDSGDDSKTEDTSSLCLRLPLEGMESKVMLKNNDLDPEEKLKNNIKGFYELMSTQTYNKMKRREQLCLLESNKDLPSGLEIKSSESTTFSGKNEIEKIERNEMVDKSNDVLPRSETQIVDSEVLIETSTSTTKKFFQCSPPNGLNENVKFEVAKKQKKTWKRRKKLRKCRICIRCFEREVKFRKWSTLLTKVNKSFQYDSSIQGDTEFESSLDSPRISQEESIRQLQTMFGVIINRKSKSASCITAEKSVSGAESKPKHASAGGFSTFRSLSNFKIEAASIKKAHIRQNSENSFDRVIPRKRRKISASYLNSSFDAERETINKNLKKNISKIKRSKKEEELPLILDYKKIGGGFLPAADILYVNEVFASSVTPERSEFDYVAESENDGIQEFGDDELEEWEAAEEELRKALKKNERECESPGNFTIITHDDSLDTDRNGILRDTLSSVNVRENESAKTLKNSSACTIVKATERLESVEKLSMFNEEKCDKDCEPSIVAEFDILSSVQDKSSPHKISPQRIPCRLPRIIMKDKHSLISRPLKELTRAEFKLPAIAKNMCIEDKLVQVPSNDISKGLPSISQQTSRIMIDNSSSFNKGDFVDSNISLSPEAQKSKNNRRFGNASIGKQAGLEVRKALAEETEDIPPKLDETFSLSRTPTAEELYPDNPMMYEEFRKYEEIYRREKESRNSSSKKQRKKKSDFGINMEDFSRTYGDSAYGSLNRKQQIDEGSDEADKLLMAMPPITSPGEKLPKFCHECGNKYPVATAKFCVECGIKRLIL